MPWGLRWSLLPSICWHHNLSSPLPHLQQFPTRIIWELPFNSLVILLSFESSLRYACKFTQKMYTVFLNLTTNLKSYPNNFLIQTMKFSPKVTNGKRGSRIPQFSKTRWTKQIITIYNLENATKLVGGFVCEFFTIEMERLFWLSWRTLRNASRSCKRRWPKRRLSSPPAVVPAQPCYLHHSFLPLSESNKKNPIKLGAKFCKFNTLKKRKRKTMKTHLMYLPS